MIYMGITVTSVVFISFFIILYHSQKRVNLFENKLLINIMMLNVLGGALHLLCYWAIYNPDTTKYFVLKSYVAYIAAFNLLFNSYIFLLTNKNYGQPDFDSKKYFFKNFIPFAIIHAGIIAAIYILPIYPYDDGVSAYTYGPGINLLSIASAITITIWVFKMIGTLSVKRKDNEKQDLKKYYAILFGIILIGAIGSLTQMVNPSILLITAVHSIVLTIIYFTIENPDVKMIEQLEILKDQADKANNAKSEFLSNMSHEIRTPLNAIVGFSESLKDDNLNKEQLEKVDDIIMASNNLLEIVNGILDISKIEANKLEIIDKEYDIKSVLDELIALTRARMGDSALDFQISIDQTIPRVLYGDNVRLKQIVLNLLTNAVKYTKEGYVRFTVSQITKGDICRLIFSVEDSGIGIKEENLPRLFSKFDRLSVEKSLTIEGTGLGLAITKKLIELMNGRIVVQSVYGKGSKFTVSIDQRIIAVTPPEVKETAVSESKVIDVKGARVLIIDDNELNIKVASTLLKKYGLEIDSATNGPDGLKKLLEEKEKYDIVFLDDMMPRMSGREVLENLHRHPEYQTPTIALTANAIEGMKEEYLKAGFDDYLSKPIERNELERVLKKFVNKQNAELSNATTTNQVQSAIKLEDSIVLPKLITSPERIEETNPKKILIVDDDNMNLKVVSMMLKNYGYDLTLVSSGSEAIMKVMDNTYDLILMDDMMPELDGSATLDNLKEIEGFNTPVVLLTANSEDDVRKKIEEHGFNGYLGKPINKEALNDITIKYLN